LALVRRARETGRYVTVQMPALEHTAMGYKSLKKLFRILKPDGHLIITYLPNRFSYTEFLARNLKKRDFHRRLFTIGEAFSMLKQQASTL
jgi:hypothetical protein